MYCGNCGKQIDPSSKFCPYCGAPVATIPQADTSDIINDETANDIDTTPDIVTPENTADMQFHQESEEGTPVDNITPMTSAETGSNTSADYTAGSYNANVTPEQNVQAQQITPDSGTTQNAGTASGTANDDGSPKSEKFIDKVNHGMDLIGYFALGVIAILIGIYVISIGHWITVAAVVVFLLIGYNIIKLKDQRTRLIVQVVCVLVAVFAWFFTGTNKYVSQVQNGTFPAYSNEKIGDSFEDFFSNPTWKYDGKDSDGNRVVTFTGGCTFADEPITVKIEFTVYEESFSITSLKFNSVEQSALMQLALLSAIYE